jgi:hypothetical protein
VLRIIILIILLFLLLPVKAQEEETHIYSNEAKNERFDTGSPIISGMIMPSYTPEMRFNVTGGMLLIFKTRRNNTYLAHSSLPLIFNISSHGDFFSTGKLTSYWFDDRFKFTLMTLYLNRDDHYWGVGMEKAVSVTKGDHTTAYHQEQTRLKPVFSLQISKTIYTGLVISRVKTIASQLNELMSEDPAILAYGTSIVSNGLGVSLTFDTRDLPTRPVNGTFIGIEGLVYDKTFKSDNNFKTLEVDYRQCLPVIREGSVLAWQADARFNSDQVPWTEMPQLGTMDDLRGYYYGQYRDRSSLYALLEYRHTFSKKASDELSRHGFVFWMGAGTVFEKLTKINSSILSTGLGYRYEIQPQRVIRLDLGFGTEYAGIYLGFCEAF